MKKTPEMLRQQAARLVEEAARQENELGVRVGRLVLNYHKNDFGGFELDKFKDEINKILKKGE